MDILALVILFGVILFVWIMYSPSDPNVWHVDPADDDIRRSKVLLSGREAPRFRGEPAEVLQSFAKTALSEQGVKMLDGSIDEGMITFVIRSRGVGLRDYITVKAAIDVDGTKISVVGRPKYTMFGSNSVERVDRWLAAIGQLYGRV